MGCNCGLGAWGRGGGSAHGCPMVGHGGVPCIGVPHAWSPPHLGGGSPRVGGSPPRIYPWRGGAPTQGIPPVLVGGSPHTAGPQAGGVQHPGGSPIPTPEAPAPRGVPISEGPISEGSHPVWRCPYRSVPTQPCPPHPPAPSPPILQRDGAVQCPGSGAALRRHPQAVGGSGWGSPDPQLRPALPPSRCQRFPPGWAQAAARPAGEGA